MKAPEIILLLVFGFSLLVAANKHGQEKEPWNFWVTLTSIIIYLVLLWSAGLFH